MVTQGIKITRKLGTRIGSWQGLWHNMPLKQNIMPLPFRNNIMIILVTPKFQKNQINNLMNVDDLQQAVKRNWNVAICW